MNFVFRHKLALVAIVKDEGLYIKEWLDYHLAVGVTKFYVYDNGSTDDTTEVLRPYIEKGIVEYVFFPGDSKQVPAYDDAIKKHRFDCKYMGFIDIDEFILPLKNERVLDIVEDIFARAKFSGGGIAINCKSFGSSGHKSRPAGGVLENYLHRAPDGYDWSPFPWKWDAHVKSIVNPRCIKKSLVHNCEYYWGKYAVDEKIRRVDGADNFVADTERIRINHYFTKSAEDWVIKRNKGNVANAGQFRPMEEFHWRDKNDVFDDGILRYREYALRTQRNEKDEAATENVSSAEILLALLREEDENWRGKIDSLLCVLHLCKKRKRASLADELLEQAVFAALEKSVASGVIVPYQLELLLDEWDSLLQNESAAAKKFLRAAINTLRQVIALLNEKNEKNGAEYFSQKLHATLLLTTEKFLGNTP